MALLAFPQAERQGKLNAFILLHEDCGDDVGRRPASQLTIRQHVAIEVYSKLLVAGTLPKDAAKEAMIAASTICAEMQ